MGTRRQQLRRWARRVFRAWLVTVPVLLVAGWFTIHHRPGWYRPPDLDDDGLQRARRESANAADDFGDRLVLGGEFEVTLRASALNEWLAALPHVWPDAQRVFPPEVSELAIHFLPELAQVGAHLSRSGWEAIVNADFRGSLSSDGQSLIVEVVAARVGSLPLPRFMVQPWLARLTARTDESGLSSGGSGADSATPRTSGRFRFRNRFVWPNGERPFRIQSIRMTDSELHLQIHPL